MVTREKWEESVFLVICPSSYSTPADDAVVWRARHLTSGSARAIRTVVVSESWCCLSLNLGLGLSLSLSLSLRVRVRVRV